MSVIDSIKHYQRSIEKYPDDEKRLLHCISKLANLPISVHHLEETGIGRTVNSFRKNEGNVGQAARNLVIKWKELVAADSSEAEEGSDGEQGFEELNDPEDQGDDFLEIAEQPEEEIEEEEESIPEHFSPPPPKVHKSNKHDKHSTHSKKSHHSDDKKDHRNNVEIKSKHKESSKTERKESKNSSSDDSKKHKKKSHKSDKEHSKKHEKRHEEKHEKRKSSSHKSSKHSKHESRSSSQDDSTSHSKKGELDKLNKKDCDKKSKRDEKSKSAKQEASSSKSNPKRKLVDFDMMAVAQNGHSSDEEVGIDSGSGTSFADALGGFTPPVKKKPKVETKVMKTLPTTPIKSLEAKPDLLSPNTKLTPLNLDITLPAITPNYQPLPNSEVLWDLGGKSSRTEEEALSIVMNKSNQRTKVYSGNKVVHAEVPSLFDLCIRILQDNIDALAYTGGVPYDILSPILERCTPEQLFTMEHHNAYLLEDTDGLWEHHCKREFRGKRREEFESWREAYSRFLLEREEKLKALTANIKQTIQKSVPVRQTKLAYVDSAVKPPRGIARKQAKYGTSASANARPSVTPSSRAAAVANAMNVTGLVPVPNPGSRASSSGSHGSFKPKKAPLMQKTLALIKSTNRYRR